MINKTVEGLMNEYFVDKKAALKYYRNLKAADYAIDYAPIIKWEFSEDQTIKLLEKTHDYISNRANDFLKSSLGFTPLEGEDIIFIVPHIDSSVMDVGDLRETMEMDPLPQDFAFDYHSFFEQVGESLEDDISKLPAVISETLEFGERYFQQIKSSEWLNLYDFSDKNSIRDFNLDQDVEHLDLKQNSMQNQELHRLYKALQDNNGLESVLDTTPSELKKGLLLKTDHLYDIIRRNKSGNSAFAIKAGQRLLDNLLEANNLTYEQLFEKQVFMGNAELTDAVLDRYNSQR